MNFNNPYSVLKIDKYSTNDDIKKAYKSLMMKHHPENSGVRSLSITVPITKQDLSLIHGTKQTFECHDVPFEVVVPYETRMNDTLVVKNILGNLTLKIKFKEKHG